MARPLRINCETPEELLFIATERDGWAQEATRNDLHGSANEWRMTAELARRLIKIAVMGDEANEWDGTERFRAAKRLALDSSYDPGADANGFLKEPE